MFGAAIHDAIAVGVIAAHERVRRVTEPERVIVALQFIADKTIVVRKGGFDAVRGIVVQDIPIERVIVARAVRRVALINAVAGKIRGIANDQRIVAIDQYDARRFAARIVTPFGTTAIVVTGVIVFDAIAGRFQQANAPAAIAPHVVRAKDIVAALDDLNALYVAGRGDILNGRSGDVVKHHPAFGQPRAEVENRIVVHIIVAKVGIADNDVGRIGDEQTELESFDGAILNNDAVLALHHDSGPGAVADNDRTAFGLAVNDLIILLRRQRRGEQ